MDGLDRQVLVKARDWFLQGSRVRTGVLLRQKKQGSSVPPPCIAGSAA